MLLDITCIKTFNDLIPKIKGIALRIKLQGSMKMNTQGEDIITKNVNELLDDLTNLGKAKQIDQNLTFDEVKALAETINSIAPERGNLVTISQLHSILMPEETTEEIREPGVNGSLDSVEDYHETPSSNFIERVYQNSAAQSHMLRFFQNSTISKIMVDLEHNLEILGDSSTLNSTLLDLQQELYENILEYIDLINPQNTLSRKLYINGQATLKEIDEYFKESSNPEVNKFYNFNHEPQTTLATWRNKAIVGEEDYRKRLQAYNSYFILKNFDSMLTKTFKSLIQYKVNEKNKLVVDPQKYRYSFLEDYNKIVNWQQEDLQQKGAYDLMPKSLQTFIESCELLDFEQGEKSTGLYLNKDHLTYFVHKIKKDYRSEKYNQKPIVFMKNVNGKSVEEIAKYMSIDNTLIDETKLTENDRIQLALLLRDENLLEINRVKAIYLRDIVNNIRHYPDSGLKLAFDIRDSLKTEFNSTIEKRIFKNLYHYFFKDSNSLYSSSFRIYSQLAQLFDTTSISDYTQYKLDNNGQVSIITLNPSRLSQEVNIFKGKINSSFVAGECDEILSKYKVDKIYKDGDVQTRIVTFQIPNYRGDLWKFKFNTRAPQSQRWTLIKESKEGNIQEFNPGNQAQGKNLLILTNTDFAVISKLAKDIFNLDLYGDLELRTAYLDQFRENGKIDYHKATLNLIDSTVPILANIKIFREKPANIEYFTNINALKNDVVYAYRYKQGNQYINGTFYITANDKPYLTEEGEIDRKEIARRMKGIVSKHLTRKQLTELLSKGAEFGTARESAYREDIKDWYGEGEVKDALRPSYKYQNVDLVSDRVKQYLEKLINARVLLNGATFKTQVRTAENTTLTIGQSSTLFAERYNRLEKYNSNLNPMHVLYDELQQASLGYAISREGTKDNSVKQHRNFNFKENFYSSVILDFIMPMYMNADWNPRFTEAVLSDKIPVPKEIIAKEKILSTKIATQKIHYILGDTYRLCFNNIEEDLKKVKDYYNENYIEEPTRENPLGKPNIPLSITDNFTQFNEYCIVRGIKPEAKLKEMSLFYNENNRKKPIALGENIHYHVNKSGNVEMVFSLLEALTTYTLLTPDQLKEHIQELTSIINSPTEKNQNKFVIQRRIDQLNKDYTLTKFTNGTQSSVYSWNSKIIKLLQAENTKQQLGDQLLQFTNRYFIDPEQAKYGKFTVNPYERFIRNSQLSFVSDLLKNDISIDLRKGEDDVQLIDLVNGIFNNIPEYKERLLNLGDTKENRELVKREFMKLWCTYNPRKLKSTETLYNTDCNNLVFAILETYNEKTNKYEVLYDSETINENESTTTVQAPVQIASRIDLMKLKAYDENNKEVKYYDSKYNLSKLKFYYKGKEVRLKLNPILEQYNLNSHLWSTLSSFSTVGSHIWSDAKKGTNTLQEESLKWYDNNKRNVIISATKLQFKLGDIWGVPNEANIAVIDDIIAYCSGILGDTPTVKPYDGATFVNPFMYYWENNSLNNQITGTTKKPIYEFYDERLAASGLIKTASFALTNEIIRDSAWAERMLWKMTNYQWLNSKGGIADVDLTLGLGEGHPELQYVKDVSQGPSYFEVINGKTYVRRIESFTKTNNLNEYKIKTQLIDPETREPVKGTQPVEDIKIIDSNYKFWKVLGGRNSCKYNENTKSYEYSENSLRLVADWAAKVKFRKNGAEEYQVKYGETPEEAHKKFENDKNLFTYRKDSYMDRDPRLNYCPLKDADIHYLVTKGAIKKYAANVNSKEAYFSDRQLNFFKIRMLEAGIQLDPTHDADQSIVSMMTQVISALAERGYTRQEAQEVYEALSELTSLAIADGMQAFNKYFTTKDRADLQTVVSKLIVDEFAFSTSRDKGVNLARSITQRLIDEGIKGEKLSFKKTKGVYPFSDPSMFSLLQTTITSALNKKAIRTKLFGVLAVLNPSHEIHKIYGQKRLSEIVNLSDLQTEQANLPTLNSIHEAYIGRTYQIILDPSEIEKEQKLINENLLFGPKTLNNSIIELKDSDYYYLWKYKLAGKKYKLKEIIYNEDTIFTGELDKIQTAIKNSNNQFNYFNIVGEAGSVLTRISDVSDLTYKNFSSLGRITSVQKINLYGRNLGSYNVHINTDQGVFNRYDIKVVQDSVLNKISNKIKNYKPSAELLTTYNETMPIEQQVYHWQDLLRQNNVNPEKEELWKYVARTLLTSNTTELSKVEQEKQLQAEMFAIKDYNYVNVYNDENINTKVQTQSYNVKNFEAILPRIYATQFGLRQGDSVSKILSNKYFFLERIMENYLEKDTPIDSNFYDICFKRSDGSHIYIKFSENPNELKLENFEQLSIDKYTNDNGTFRMHPFKENTKLYPLADNSDQVYYDRNSNTEVIVTKDIEYYIKNLKYLNIEISDKAKESIILNALQNNNKRLICSELLKRIDASGGFNNFLQKQKTVNDLLSEYLYNKNRSKKEIVNDIIKTDKRFYNLLETLANKQHVSFKQSLNFTVARIPAQGMQSFMAMEIVGFTESGVNDCYVSAEQIRLQGSDYDVDKATFMGYAFDKSGIFVKWSPFFQDYSYAQLFNSMYFLPYPTGRKIKIEKGNVNSIDYSKYKDLFVTKEIKIQKTVQENEEDLNNTETNTILVLKKNRTASEQKLLGELIKEVNKIQKRELEKNNTLEDIVLYSDGTISDEQLKAIQTFVNKHNNYINIVEREEKENLLKNFVSFKTFSISRNPVNSIAGETSVDDSAEPFKKLTSKSNYGTKPEDNLFGNSAILWLALQQNHTGKDVIAIAASAGLKCLHAMTQAYNNAVVNNPDISNLWFDVKIMNPDGLEQHYNFLADTYLGIKPYESLSSQYETLRNTLLSKGLSEDKIEILWKNYLTHKEWAGSNDSGILTLATDNAKELQLERLNAGVDLAGLYLYGISIGMPAKSIFDIMTSQTAQVLSRLTKGNIFDAPRFLDQLNGALDFLEKEPLIPDTRISKTKLEEIANNNKIDGIKFDGLTLKSLLTLHGTESIKQTIVELSRRGEFDKYLKLLKDIRQRIYINKATEASKDLYRKYSRQYGTKTLSYEEEQQRRSVARLIDYACSINEIVDSHINKFGLTEDGNIIGQPFADLINIRTLADGETELTNTRMLLGLNQGQKTKLTDIYNFYENFSNILKKQRRTTKKDLSDKDKKQLKEYEKIIGKDLRVDFHKFNSDTNYKDTVIKAYDIVKQSINPYWVVTQVPHFNQYLKAAHLIYLESRVSAKSRLMIDKIVPYIHTQLNPNKTTRSLYYQKALNFIDGLMTNAFLREERFIEIPAGNKIFEKSSNEEVFNYQVFDHPVYIELGTQEGNETFRTWMNNKVIPELINKYQFQNSFLKDLTSNYSNNTPSGNNIKVYTLPIDMIPKSDTETDQLSKYIMDFYKLKSERYYVSDDSSYTIPDLFFYYNLINFQNRGGMQSLTTMFDTFIKTKEQCASNRYIEFISNLDTDYNFEEGVDYTEEMLQKALALNVKQVGLNNAESHKMPYIYVTDNYTLMNRLYKYAPKAIAAIQEYRDMIGEEYASKPDKYEKHKYILDNFNLVNIESLSTRDTHINIKPNESQSITLNDIHADIQIAINKNKVNSIVLSNIHTLSSTGEPQLIINKSIIPENEVTKYIKVYKLTDGKYEFKINPVSLSIKLSSLKRAC